MYVHSLRTPAAMARTPEPNSQGSQFFVVLDDAAQGALENARTYTIFGTVVEGLDVAKQIQNLPIQDPSAGIEGQQPAQSVYLEKVTIRESSER